MDATTHAHVYVGLAIEDEDVRATREWIASLGPWAYARLLDLLRNEIMVPTYDLILNELRAPNGRARDHLHVMEMRGTGVHGCPRCPA